jgi:hypothetical protein
MYAAQFNKSAFTRITSEPLWEKANVYFSENGQYIEIPYRVVSLKDLEKSTSMSLDHLVATISDTKEVVLNIVHYFAQDIKTTLPNFEQLNYYDTANFHGFITKYDLNNNVIAVDRFINGVKSQGQYNIKDKKKTDLLSKANEGCENITETNGIRYCSFWYNPDNLDDVEIIDCNIEYETTTYEDCSGSSGDGVGGGVTIITIEEYFKLINNLTGKSNCVFEKLKELKLFQNTIKKFGGKSNYNLTLKNGFGCNSLNDDGCADARDIANGNITIYIQKEGRGTLDLAATILHEGIHAEIYKYVDEHKKGIDPNKRENLLDYYFQYKVDNGGNRFATSNAQHQHMADAFVTPIAEALRQLDNNQFPLNDYLSLAWNGLRSYAVKSPNGLEGYWKDGKWTVLDKNNSYVGMSKILNNTNFNKECK